MKYNKTLIALALMAVTGSASAALTNNSTTGTNEAFLVAFDPSWVDTDGVTLGRTYNLDLGITFNGLKADLALNNGSFQAALTKNLSADTNYTNFVTGASAQANIIFGVFAAGDTVTSAGANNGLFVTGNSLTAPVAAARTSPAGSLTTWGAQDTAINAQAADINNGTFTGLSSLVKTLDTPSTGQANNIPSFTNLWGGAFVGDNPTGGFNTNVNFYYGSNHIGTFQQRVGGVVTQGAVLLAQSDITMPTQLVLSPAGLTAVPLPAAVWLFGAGLMGMMRLNRRKSVQA